MNFRERTWAKPLVGALVIIVAAIAVLITYAVSRPHTDYGGPSSPAAAPAPTGPGYVTSYINQDGSVFWFPGSHGRYVLSAGTSVQMLCWWDNPTYAAQGGPDNGEMFKVTDPAVGLTGYVAAGEVSNQWAVPHCSS